MTKQQFINLTGEDPVDILGQDWENYIEDYFEEDEKEKLGMEYGFGDCPS